MKYYKYDNSTVYVLETTTEKLNDLYYNIIKTYNVKENHKVKTISYRKNTIADIIFDNTLKEYIKNGFKPLNNFISSDGYKLVNTDNALATLFLRDAGYIKESEVKSKYKKNKENEDNKVDKTIE